MVDLTVLSMAEQFNGRRNSVTINIIIFKRRRITIIVDLWPLRKKVLVSNRFFIKVRAECPSYAKSQQWEFFGRGQRKMSCSPCFTLHQLHPSNLVFVLTYQIFHVCSVKACITAQYFSSSDESFSDMI